MHENVGRKQNSLWIYCAFQNESENEEFLPQKAIDRITNSLGWCTERRTYVMYKSDTRITHFQGDNFFQGDDKEIWIYEIYNLQD